MTAHPTLLAEVDRTVAAIDPADADAAAVQLARLYAAELDRAAAVGRAADKALRDAAASGDEALVEQVEALRARLGQREALDRIGARLVAVLVELRATPRSRAAAKGGKPAGGGALARLRAVP